jgi:hypothetical protein
MMDASPDNVFVQIDGLCCGDGTGSFMDGSHFVVFIVKSLETGKQLPNVVMRVEDYIKLVKACEPIVNTSLSKGWTPTEE